MPVAGEVRVVPVVSPELNDAQSLGIPFTFGVGRQDRAVQLWAVHYYAQKMAPSQAISREMVLALSENPEHELAPPATHEAAYTDLALYGMVFDWWQAAAFGATDGNYLFRLPQWIVPLYGILRPFRQIFLIRNDLGTAMKFRAEIYYTPVTLNQVEQQALNRQKGGYRRT